MNFIKLKEDGSFDHQIQDEANIEWDETHFCPVNKLTAEEATYFRVVPIIATPAPATASFQTARRNGTIQDVDGNWMYSWEIVDFTQQEIDNYLTTTKAEVWEKIKKYRDNLEGSGVKVGTKWFHSDEASRIKILGLVIAGASIPANLMWKTMDGSFVTMTQTLANQIFGASLTVTSTIFAKAEEHKALMEVSADPALYNYFTGWPDVYV